LRWRWRVSVRVRWTVTPGGRTVVRDAVFSDHQVNDDPDEPEQEYDEKPSDPAHPTSFRVAVDEHPDEDPKDEKSTEQAADGRIDRDLEGRHSGNQGSRRRDRRRRSLRRNAHPGNEVKPGAPQRPTTCAGWRCRFKSVAAGALELDERTLHPQTPDQTFAPHFPQNVAPGASGDPQLRHVICAGGTPPAGGGAAPPGGGCHGCCP